MQTEEAIAEAEKIVKIAGPDGLPDIPNDFNRTEFCCENRGVAYVVRVTVGDCFCPKCEASMIKMRRSRSMDCFIGECEQCKRFIQAKIVLEDTADFGKWEIIG